MELPVFIVIKPSSSFIEDATSLCREFGVPIAAVETALSPQLMKGNSDSHRAHSASAKERVRMDAQKAITWILQSEAMGEGLSPEFLDAFGELLEKHVPEWDIMVFMGVDIDIPHEAQACEPQLGSKLRTLLSLV